MYKLKKQSGFTLTELMITVAIVGILASVAYPAYQNHIRNGKLVDVVTSLSTAKNKMEHYYQDYRSYEGACKSNLVKPSLAATENFNFTCLENKSGEGFILTATGKGMIEGFSFTINEMGQKDTPTAQNGYETGSCWIKNKHGC